ncbi:MAG TPA: hypothetical protein VG651_24095 [Stellaceae bacterium]|nr:hypothetical protein [Stellaceae bacterium]
MQHGEKVATPAGVPANNKISHLLWQTYLTHHPDDKGIFRTLANQDRGSPVTAKWQSITPLTNVAFGINAGNGSNLPKTPIFEEVLIPDDVSPEILIPACIKAAAEASARDGYIDAKSCVALARELYREATRQPWQRGDDAPAETAFRKPRPTDILYSPIAGDSQPSAP